MAPWHYKLVLDTAKAVIPFQPALRQLKRHIFPYTTNPQNDAGLLVECVRQISSLHQQGVAVRGIDVVEIGSGWIPVLPLVFYMAGARQVTTVDRERLIDANTMRGAIGLIEANWHLFEGFGWTSPCSDGDLDRMLDRHSIRYLAPGEFLDMRPRSADLIVSRAVFEHIPPRVLDDIMAQSRRVLRPGGYVCHTIDMSDHWEHQDKSISRVNFLRYHDWSWNLTGLNVQNYQNRLRRFEYVEMFRRHGFTILLADGSPDPAATAALETMPICDRYAQVRREELAVLTTMIVGRSPADG